MSIGEEPLLLPPPIHGDKKRESSVVGYCIYTYKLQSFFFIHPFIFKYFFLVLNVSILFFLLEEFFVNSCNIFTLQLNAEFFITVNYRTLRRNISVSIQPNYSLQES